MLVPLRSKLLEAHGFRHGFSPRQGGVSRGAFAGLNLGRELGDDAAAVAENHRRFAASIGYDPDRLFGLRQVHGRHIQGVAPSDEPVAVSQLEGDALWAPSTGVTPDPPLAVGVRTADRAPLAVGVRTADCVPLLIADVVRGTVAAVHAGWRGVAAGIAPAVVRRLEDLAHSPSDLRVATFPHIRACCFEVGEEVVPQLLADLPATVREQAVIRPTPGARPHIDLGAVLTEQLRAVGVPAQHIDDVPGCTRCDAERFYSFRRDGADSGRHVTAICPRPPAAGGGAMDRGER